MEIHLYRIHSLAYYREATNHSQVQYHNGRLIDYEHQKAERAGYKRSRPAIRARKADSVANEVILNPLVSESQTTEDQSAI